MDKDPLPISVMSGRNAGLALSSSSYGQGSRHYKPHPSLQSVKWEYDGKVPDLAFKFHSVVQQLSLFPTYHCESSRINANRLSGKHGS